MQNIFLNIFLIIGILLTYSGVSGILTDIYRKRKVLNRKYLILMLGIMVVFSAIIPNLINNKITIFIKYVSIYFSITFIIFCILNIIVNLNIRKRTYNVIIVLGGYLLNGNQLTRALTKRLNLAIELYNSQKERTKIIVSGGKIREETITEAEAMEKYLISKNIPIQDIIKEDKSKNTLENFKFSKQKLEELNISENIAFVSNNFHILRSKIYASKNKVKAKGIGAKTLWYYFPEAFVNEYLAILLLSKNILIVYFFIAIFLTIIAK